MNKNELLKYAEEQYRNNDVPDEVLDLLPSMQALASYHDKCVPMIAAFEAGRRSTAKE